MSHKYNRSYSDRSRDPDRPKGDRYDDRQPSQYSAGGPYAYEGYPPQERDRFPPMMDQRGQRWSPERTYHPRMDDRDDRRPSRRDSRFDERRESPCKYPPRSYDAGRHDYRERRDHAPIYDKPKRGEPYGDSRPSRRSPPRSERYQGKEYYPPDDYSRPRVDDDIIQNSIFLSNLPKDVTTNELAQLFGSIGVIQTDKKTGSFKIKVYQNSDGSSKGEASIYYQDAQAARAAIEWFDRVELRGSHIHVEMADRSYSRGYTGRDSRGGGRGGRGGYRGFSGGGRDRDFSRGGRDGPPGGPKKPSFIQPGDWVCSSCKNNNFAWRTSCNRCQAEKPKGASAAQDSFGSDTRASPPRAGNPYGAPGYQY